jgi:hypothetical protein
VTHLRAALVSISLALLPAASGCARPNDTPRLQEEARQVAAEFQERFEELAHRAEAISRHGNSVRADAANSADAQRVYREAITKIEDARQLLKGVPGQIEAGAKGEDRDALPRLIDSLRERFERDAIEVNANLDAVDAWIGYAELNRAAPPAAAPNPAGTVQEGAPQPTGSDAPVR